ncbi:hypothetical protein EGT74_18070 [Chitinophaga lutea]|uniref:DUF2178 domain-containing protein n=1 Tax=Chitinophaga lutea TaxID=2488634 RepID=A0A3N4PMA4_9BACT|nr:hypothetical protein [Chitinophaga lutea]RPE08925.1 hypothetical protein EGT74_18070 [Chitinophaga lutea]
MKHTRILLPLLLLPVFASAQGNPGPYIDRDIFNVCATIAFAALLLGFLLALSRQFLDYRIKAKLTESGLPEPVITSLLRQDAHNGKLNMAKWAIIFAGIALACTIIYYTLPVGVHSLAILSACLSISFGAYFLLLHKLKR